MTIDGRMVGPGEAAAVTLGVVVAGVALLCILYFSLDVVSYVLDRILPARDGGHKP